MEIRFATSGLVGTNQYYVELEGRHYVVDAPDGNEGFVEEVKKLTKRLDAVLLTHGHFDHTSGLQNLLTAFPGTPVYLEKNDWYMLKDGGNQKTLSRMGLHAYPLPDFTGTELLDYPEEIGPFTVLRTPGHTMGSVCLFAKEEGILFSGDTLFRGGEGRTDLGGDYRTIRKSLSRLMELDENTNVLPGHGEDTTIGSEKAWRR